MALTRDASGTLVFYVGGQERAPTQHRVVPEDSMDRYSDTTGVVPELLIAATGSTPTAIHARYIM